MPLLGKRQIGPGRKKNRVSTGQKFSSKKVESLIDILIFYPMVKGARVTNRGRRKHGRSRPLFSGQFWAAERKEIGSWDLFRCKEEIKGSV